MDFAVRGCLLALMRPLQLWEHSTTVELRKRNGEGFQENGVFEYTGHDARCLKEFLHHKAKD